MIAPLAGLAPIATPAMPQRSAAEPKGFEAHLTKRAAAESPQAEPTATAPEEPLPETEDQATTEDDALRLAEPLIPSAPEASPQGEAPVLPGTLALLSAELAQDAAPDSATAQPLQPEIAPSEAPASMPTAPLQAAVSDAPLPDTEATPAAEAEALAEVDPMPTTALTEADTATAASTDAGMAQPIGSEGSAHPRPSPAMAPSLMIDAIEQAPHAETVEAAPQLQRPDTTTSTEQPRLPLDAQAAAKPVDPSPPAPTLAPAADAPSIEKAQSLSPTTPAPAAEAAPRATTPLLRNVLDRLSEVEIAEGKTRLLLRPKGLGVLEIDVARHLNGRLHISIRAENPLLLDALRQESGAMSSYLGERGFDLSGGEPDLGRYQPPVPEPDQDAAALPEDETTDPVTPRSLLDGSRLDLLT